MAVYLRMLAGEHAENGFTRFCREEVELAPCKTLASNSNAMQSFECRSVR